jgi:hypothetical protein
MFRFLKLAGGALVALALMPSALGGELESQERTAIDAHALAAPPEVEKSTKTLAAYLTSDLHTEQKKVRAIYRWITDRIEYDVDAFLAGRLSKMNASEVLAKRQSVCDGFATLFEELSHEAGLDVKTIAGFAKGYVGQGAHHFDKPNHMWNALKLDGEWRMIDATWGAGYVADGKYKKVLSEAFFMVPPEQLVFSHFPQDDAWQLQHTPHLSQKEFEALPEVKTTFFNNEISALAAWETLSNPDFAGYFVQTYEQPYRLASVQKAPLAYNLKPARAYQFRIRSEAFEKMAVAQTGTWLEMEKQDNAFSLDLQSQIPGQLLVLGKAFGTETYTAILGYEVKP